jgi:predicted nuclease of predicted toxin-antitoxin system
VIVWVDAQLSPALAPWMAEEFGVDTYSVKYLGLRDSTDAEIFAAARAAAVVVLTKDSDFVRLLHEHGPPPQILWITLGNTSNSRMKEVLRRTLPAALAHLRRGEPLVEISEHRP